ncbi:DNA repair protein RAD50-like [Fagus crenata]
MIQCEAEPSSPLTCEPLVVVAPPNVSVASRKPHSSDRKYNIADGMRQMFDPLKGLPVLIMFAPAGAFLQKRRMSLLKRLQRVKAASSAEHMKVLAVDSQMLTLISTVGQAPWFMKNMLKLERKQFLMLKRFA